MSSEMIVAATLVVYKLLLLLVGYVSMSRTSDAEDFFLGGRQLGPLVAAVSASASSSSAWTLMGVSGLAWSIGLSAVWIFPACVAGFIVNWFLLAPGLHRLSHDRRLLTATDVVVGEGEGWQRRALPWVCTGIILVSFSAYVAAQFQGAGMAFEETFAISRTGSVVLGASIVLAYTLMGGFWAVSITDTIQGLVMAAASVLLPVVALAAVGGPAGLLNGVQGIEGDYWTVTGSRGLAASVGFVLGLLGIGLGYPGQPHVVNRFMALRDEAAALRQAQRISVCWAVVVYGGMLILGWCGRLLYPGLADRELVFVSAANGLFPPVLSGVVLAAVLSAIMSTADSQLLVGASAVSHDLRGERGTASLFVSRLVVGGITLAALLLAIGVDASIFKRVLFAWTALGNAFGPVLLVTVIRGRLLRSQTTFVSVLGGFVLSVSAYSWPETAGAVERILPFFLCLFWCLWRSSARGMGRA
jgi:sodium/proline symporter